MSDLDISRFFSAEDNAFVDMILPSYGESLAGAFGYGFSWEKVLWNHTFWPWLAPFFDREAHLSHERHFLSPQTNAAGEPVSKGKSLHFHTIASVAPLLRACANGGGALRPYVRERHLPALLESEVCRIVPQGIDLDGVYFDYTDEHRPEWFARLKRVATAGPARTIRVHFDRMTLNRIYLVPKDPKKPVEEIPLSRLSREWLDYSRREYDAAKEFRKTQAHPLKHEHNLRQVVFGQSIAADTVLVDQAIKEKYGTVKERNRVANALGQDGPLANQMACDTARDQVMHPTKAPTTRVQSDGELSEIGISYDELLGLN